MSGDKAAGDWTPWPVVDGQLELPVEVVWPDTSNPDWPEIDP